jgi:hypothetical protein
MYVLPAGQGPDPIAMAGEIELFLDGPQPHDAIGRRAIACIVALLKSASLNER